jgi:hypothetical protein
MRNFLKLFSLMALLFVSCGPEKSASSVNATTKVCSNLYESPETLSRKIPKGSICFEQALGDSNTYQETVFSVSIEQSRSIDQAPLPSKTRRMRIISSLKDDRNAVHTTYQDVKNKKVKYTTIDFGSRQRFSLLHFGDKTYYMGRF